MHNNTFSASQLHCQMETSTYFKYSRWNHVFFRNRSVYQVTHDMYFLSKDLLLPIILIQYRETPICKESRKALYKKHPQKIFVSILKKGFDIIRNTERKLRILKTDYETHKYTELSQWGRLQYACVRQWTALWGNSLH